MTNELLTIGMITKESLMVMHEEATFLKTINNQYNSEFAQTGAKIGELLKIRKPSKFTRTQGNVTLAVQDIIDESTSLTIATQDHVDMAVLSSDFSLKIDEFSKRYIRPAISTLISNIEADVLVGLTKKVPNIVGTAGTIVGAGGDTFAINQARARLNQSLAPKKNRFTQIDSSTMANIVNAQRALFNDQNQIEKGYLEGYIGRTQGADFYENERTLRFTNSADVAGALNTYTITQGDSDLTVLNFSVAPNEGMVFTIAGVFDCHPETKQPYGTLKQFVVTTGSTTTTINFAPAIYLTGARQNVVNAAGGILDPSTVTTSAVAFFGAASTTYQQNLMYHKDAFTFVTADLPLYDDAMKCSRQEYEGLSLRCWKASDIVNDRMILRIDILYGFDQLYPEWACRISN